MKRQLVNLKDRRISTQKPQFRPNIKEVLRGRFPIVLLMTIVLLGAVILWSYSQHQPAKNTSQTVAGVQVNEKMAPEWWNTDYYYYINVTVANQGNSVMQPGEIVTLKLDHKHLVEMQRSRSDGNDLHLVYLTADGYQELIISLSNSNTREAALSFGLVNLITSEGNDSNYYLYYGNEVDQGISRQTQVMPTTRSTFYTITLGSEVGARFYTEMSRKWLLISSNPSLHEDYKYMTYRVRIDNYEINDKDLVIQVQGPQELSINVKPLGGNVFEAIIHSDNIVPGTYTIQTAIGDTHFKSKAETFYVSYPLYVTWTIDYEGFDVRDEYLNYMAQISSEYGMPITHLFNPRVFIAKEISQARAKYLAEWVKIRYQQNQDEIGLHLHMHLDMVAAAGLVPKTDPRWGGRTNGHDVLTSAYNYSEFSQLLQWSKRKFSDYGLPEPVSYRAGGWNIDLENMRALADNGFKIESSGREYFVWGPNQIKSDWHLTSTAKPYLISTQDMNTSTAPNLNLWEFPNNGMDSTNNKAQALISKFNDNYKNLPLSQAQAVTYLSHPHWFGTYDAPQMHSLLQFIAQFKAEKDSGPVVYTTLTGAFGEWSR